MREQIGAFQNDLAGGFGLQPGTLKAAQDVDRQLTRLGFTLEYTFLAALKPVMPEVQHLSKALGGAVTEFLKSDGFKGVVGVVAKGMHTLGEWLGKPEFQTDIKAFVDGMSAMTSAIGRFVRWVTGATPGIGGGSGGSILPGGGDIWNRVRGSGVGPLDRLSGAGIYSPWHPRNLAPWNPKATSATKAAFEAANTIQNPDIRDAANIISWREAKDQDLLNYRYQITGYDKNGVALGYTASGYYQMLTSNWHKYGNGIVDFAKYPLAKGAPRELQDAVFARMYAAEGYHPWSAAAGGSIKNDADFQREMQYRRGQRDAPHPAAAPGGVDTDAIIRGWGLDPAGVRGGAGKRAADQAADHARYLAWGAKWQRPGDPKVKLHVELHNQTGSSPVISAAQMSVPV